MSSNSLEIPDVERRASERAKRARESRDQKAAERALARQELTHKQVEFLEIFSASSWLPFKDICKLAKVKPTTVERWKDEHEGFQKAVAKHYNQMIGATNMSRRQVMKGILEAIDMAKDQRQPNSMITGWKEIGRMCGFYEPERREISLSVNGQAMLEELKTASREKLLQLAQEQDAVEAEYVEIVEEDV